MLFIVDFDGTVAPRDTVDSLLERFAKPAWKDIEDDWISGRLSSQECMKAQLALVEAERTALDEFFQGVAIDPGFAEFVRHVRAFAEIAIVSDGLDYPIHGALKKHFVPSIPVFANRLLFRESGVDIGFPHFDTSCAPRSGVCKCAVARATDGGRGLPVVLIGDGRSDYCIARSADYVFAKGSLRKFCESEGIAHVAFESFADVMAVVRKWGPAIPEKLHYELRHVS